MKKGAKIQDLCSRFQFTAKEERRKKNIKKIAKCNIKLVRQHSASKNDLQ